MSHFTLKLLKRKSSRHYMWSDWGVASKKEVSRQWKRCRDGERRIKLLSFEWAYVAVVRRICMTCSSNCKLEALKLSFQKLKLKKLKKLKKNASSTIYTQEVILFDTFCTLTFRQWVTRRMILLAYYEAGINCLKKFPAKNICWYWFYVCFCFVGNYSTNYFWLRKYKHSRDTCTL